MLSFLDVCCRNNFIRKVKREHLEKIVNQGWMLRGSDSITGVPLLTMESFFVVDGAFISNPAYEVGEYLLQKKEIRKTDDETDVILEEIKEQFPDYYFIDDSWLNKLLMTGSAKGWLIDYGSYYIVNKEHKIFVK